MVDLSANVISKSRWNPLLQKTRIDMRSACPKSFNTVESESNFLEYKSNASLKSSKYCLTTNTNCGERVRS